MSTISSARRIVLAATLGTLALGTPALATAKAVKITVPASVMKDPTSKLCMPQTTGGAKRDKTLPATMCLTQEEWAARGVTIVVKS